jgi:hypothetical protein
LKKERERILGVSGTLNLEDRPEGDVKAKWEGDVESSDATPAGDLRVGVMEKKREGEVGDCAEKEGERGRGMIGESSGAGSERSDVGASFLSTLRRPCCDDVEEVLSDGRALLWRG